MTHFTLEEAISIIEAEQVIIKAFLIEHYPDTPLLQDVLNDWSSRFVIAFHRANVKKAGDL